MQTQLKLTNFFKPINTQELLKNFGKPKTKSDKPDIDVEQTKKQSNSMTNSSKIENKKELVQNKLQFKLLQPQQPIKRKREDIENQIDNIDQQINKDDKENKNKKDKIEKKKEIKKNGSNLKGQKNNKIKTNVKKKSRKRFRISESDEEEEEDDDDDDYIQEQNNDEEEDEYVYKDIDEDEEQDNNQNDELSEDEEIDGFGIKSKSTSKYNYKQNNQQQEQLKLINDKYSQNNLDSIQQIEQFKYVKKSLNQSSANTNKDNQINQEEKEIQDNNKLTMSQQNIQNKQQSIKENKQIKQSINQDQQINQQSKQFWKRSIPIPDNIPLYIPPQSSKQSKNDKLTPLEMQVVQLHLQYNGILKETQGGNIRKKENNKQSPFQSSQSSSSQLSSVIRTYKQPNIILFILVGYKYFLFGQNSLTAHKYLWSGLKRHFLVSSLPTFRLQYYVRKLCQQGLKVGIVTQQEHKAIKRQQQINKNSVFKRELESIYTKGTLIGQGYDSFDEDIVIDDDEEEEQEEEDDDDDDDDEQDQQIDNENNEQDEYEIQQKQQEDEEVKGKKKSNGSYRSINKRPNNINSKNLNSNFGRKNQSGGFIVCIIENVRDKQRINQQFIEITNDKEKEQDKNINKEDNNDIPDLSFDIWEENENQTESKDAESEQQNQQIEIGIVAVNLSTSDIYYSFYQEYNSNKRNKDGRKGNRNKTEQILYQLMCLQQQPQMQQQIQSQIYEVLLPLYTSQQTLNIILEQSRNEDIEYKSQNKELQGRSADIIQRENAYGIQGLMIEERITNENNKDNIDIEQNNKSIMLMNNKNDKIKNQMKEKEIIYFDDEREGYGGTRIEIINPSLLKSNEIKQRLNEINNNINNINYIYNENENVNSGEQKEQKEQTFLSKLPILVQISIAALAGHFNQMKIDSSYIFTQQPVEIRIDEEEDEEEIIYKHNQMNKDFGNEDQQIQKEQFLIQSSSSSFSSQLQTNQNKPFSSSYLLQQNQKQSLLYTDLNHSMKLSSSTLRNLEIFQANQTISQYNNNSQSLSQQQLNNKQNKSNKIIKANLMNAINRTSSQFGERLFRRWLLSPLVDIHYILKRQNAVSELIQTERGIQFASGLRLILKSIPDIEKGLPKIQMKKISPKELIKELEAFEKLCRYFISFIKEQNHNNQNIVRENIGYQNQINQQNEKEKGQNYGKIFQSDLLNELIEEIPSEYICNQINYYLSSINKEKAMKNEYSDLFVKGFSSQIDQLFNKEEEIKKSLQLHLNEIRNELGLGKELDYSTFMGDQYVIQLPAEKIDTSSNSKASNKQNKQNSSKINIPSSYIRINSTRSIARFHTQFIEEQQILIDEIKAMKQIISKKIYEKRIIEMIIKGIKENKDEENNEELNSDYESEDERRNKQKENGIDSANQSSNQYSNQSSNQYIPLLLLLRRTIQSVSNLDCLISLQQYALQGNVYIQQSKENQFEQDDDDDQQKGQKNVITSNQFVRPIFIDNNENDEQILEIQQGRHPMLELFIQNGQCVPNSISMSTHYCKNNNRSINEQGKQNNSPSVMIITGPNAGGKTVLMKQTALLIILAQIGSFIPAKKMMLSVFDQIYTRMTGGGELNVNNLNINNTTMNKYNMQAGKSTFLNEMEEASEILKKASKRSLIVLDEIGRGTATHDGTAIAYATLAYIINRIKCLCLFVTHYPSLAYIDEDNDVNELNDNKQQLQQKIKVVQPFHMNYTHLPSDPTHIVFLYTLVPGLAEKSFGLNVARLAGIPSQIIQRASQKSAQFESIMNQSKDKQKEKDNEELKK